MDKSGSCQSALHFVTNPMQRITKPVFLENAEATISQASRLAKVLQAGDIVLLRGALGAGKTSFARGVIGALCQNTEVPSPTYTLVQTYDCPHFTLWHFDLYRLEHEQGIWELGIEEALDNGVCLIEWPERIADLLSGNELDIHIDFADKGRQLSYYGNSNWSERLENP